MSVLDVYRCGCGWWVASYARWSAERACPLEAVAAVLQFEVESLIGGAA